MIFTRTAPAASNSHDPCVATIRHIELPCMIDRVHSVQPKPTHFASATMLSSTGMNLCLRAHVETAPGTRTANTPLAACVAQFSAYSTHVLMAEHMRQHRCSEVVLNTAKQLVDRALLSSQGMPHELAHVSCILRSRALLIAVIQLHTNIDRLYSFRVLELYSSDRQWGVASRTNDTLYSEKQRSDLKHCPPLISCTPAVTCGHKKICTLSASTHLNVCRRHKTHRVRRRVLPN